jgi:hypothetical protein
VHPVIPAMTHRGLFKAADIMLVASRVPLLRYMIEDGLFVFKIVLLI